MNSESIEKYRTQSSKDDVPLDLNDIYIHQTLKRRQTTSKAFLNVITQIHCSFDFEI